MQRLSSFLLCLFLFLPGAVSFAAEVAVFGEQQYIRTTGAPNVYEDTFSALSVGARLVIHNGSEVQERGKSDRVSSGYVYINDQLIFGPDDFKQQRYEMEVPVSLEENNTIRVVLNSIPDSFLSLSLIQDIPPPTIHLEAAPLSIMLGTDATLTWSSKNADTVLIDQGIGEVAVIGSTTVSPAETTTYMVTATNRGGSATASVTVEVRYPAPTVTLAAGEEEIRAGEITVLTWNSTSAETLNIEPGIGTVEQNGNASVSPSETTTYTITASGRGGTVTTSVTITVMNTSIDLMATSPGIDDASCPDRVSLSVQLNNTGEEVAGAGVYLSFYNGDPHNGGFLIGTVRSVNALDPGAAETVTLPWSSPPVGDAAIFIRVDDTGDGRGEFDEFDEENNFVSYDVSLCEDLPDPDANSISGEVIDAVTGERLSNVVVELHPSENGEPGPVLASFRTNYEGVFIFRDLDPGIYIITGTVAGYADGQRQATLVQNAVLQHQDLVLSPVLSDDDIRIVLTWGQHPEDLEAHLTAPNPDGCRHHCFYWIKEIPGASLDLDDRHSYGPETITITEPISGTYRYYVHNFTDRTNFDNYNLAYNGAEVKVYIAGQDEPVVFKTPSYRYTKGTVWHVFDINGDTGEITPVNKFTHQSEPGQIDFPRINQSPANRAYWGEHYRSSVRAEDPDNDTLTYTLLQGPEGMVVSKYGSIDWTPGGITDPYYPIKIKVSDGRCGEDTISFNLVVVSKPTAIFNASPCSAYNENGDITLSWSTKYAGKVFIDNGIGEVELNGSLTIPSPEQPVVYTLTALNDVHETTRQTPVAPPGPTLNLPSRPIEPTHSANLSYDCGSCSAICEIDQGNGKVSGRGYIVVKPMETTTYTITSSNGAGERKCSGTLAVELPKPPSPPTPPVIPAPTIYSFSGTSTCNWSPRMPITLSWTTNNAITCEITPGVGQVDCNSSIVVTPEEGGSYTFIARGEGGVRSKNFRYPDPAGLDYFSASPDHVKPGDETTLSWYTYCADTVTISGIGEVGKTGSLSVIAPDTLPHTYIMTVTNEGSYGSYYLHLYLIDPPTGYLEADNHIIKNGESVELQWKGYNADTCIITPDIGEVDCKGGVVTITPDKPITYYLKLEGAGGAETYSLHISFIPPDVDIQATPETINEGESSTLSWIFSNATSCSIDQGIGEVQLGKTLQVSPSVTTTYTMTAIGPGGTRTDQLTVNVIPVNPPPTATIAANPSIIWNGDETTLTWSTKNAESVTISPDIGSVTASGSQVIAPKLTTTYTISATGPGGNDTSQARVTVLQHTPIVSLTASPDNIELGGTAILTWASEHADTVTITPDIGQVDASGSMEVSPDTTTNYTITATGPGGSANQNATVTVIYPPPTATFTAEPASINKDDSAQLAWSAENADACAITPLIGPVPCSETQAVTPTDTTTYTFSATGRGGSVSKSATVTVIHPSPTVTISAEPTTIETGGSAVLSWISTNANSVTIDQGIGQKPPNGQVTITPGATTTYTITATGPGGSASGSVTVTVSAPSPITLTITSPIDAQTVTKTNLMVTGSVVHAQGLETGVMVNGIVAHVHNNTFTANQVPLRDEINTIIVVATDALGETVQKSITLNVQPEVKQIELTAVLESGLAPLQTEIRVDGNFTFSEPAQLAYSGTGAVEYLPTTEPDTFTVKMTEPGLYTFTATAKDDLGTAHTDTIAILAQDRTQLDVLLKTKWNGMKMAMAAGNIEEAVNYFTYSQRQTFTELYTLVHTELPRIAADMQGIELIYQKNDTAEYRLNKDVNFNGSPMTVSFYVYFQKEADGIWRIRDY